MGSKTKSAKLMVSKPEYRMKVVQDKTKYNRKKRQDNESTLYTA